MNFAWARPALIAVSAAALLAVAACNRQPAVSGEDLARNAEAAAAFMKANASEEGVQTLPSGLQYKVVASGPATGVHPDRNDLVRVDYEGSLTDGTVFDSSVQRGQTIEFGVTRVIPGWVEALQLMSVGDKWRLFIPPGLGYGARAAGKIPPNSALIFEVELIAIK